MLHRTRSLIVRQRTMAANALRAHLAEFGLVCSHGVRNPMKLVQKTFMEDGTNPTLPKIALRAVSVLVRRLEELGEERHDLERELQTWHRQNETGQRLAAIPRIGVVTAKALVATISDIHAFKSGRQFAAWLGLVPKQNSSGEKTRLGRISKTG